MKLFDPPCRNTEICPPWKSCLECEWRVCVSSTDALVVYKFIHHPEFLPEIFINNKFFTFNDKIHKYNTRT